MDVDRIIRAAASPALATDEQDRILVSNDAAERLLGHSAESLAGRVFHDVLDARDVFGNHALAAAAVHRMVRRGEPVRAFELDVSTASGSRVRLRVSVIPVLGPESSRYRLVYHLMPRWQRGRAEEALDLLLKSLGDAGWPAVAAEGEGDRSAAPLLTRREREVLQQLASGKHTAAIAASLHVSVHTVRSHSRNIFRKLGVHSRAEAVSVAFHRGLL